MKTKTFTTSQVNTSVGIDFKEKSKKSTTFTNFHRHPSATSKFGWLKGQRYLILLHKILYKYGLIDCRSHNQFQKHFLGTQHEICIYIRWYGTLTELIDLFDRLSEDNYIPKNEKKKHKIVFEHFCDSSGNLYGLTSMKSTRINLRNTLYKSKIDEIMDLLETGDLKLLED